jgi:hypothetical protein
MLPDQPRGPAHNLVVIENHLIDSLAANDMFRREFPYLAALVRPKTGQGCRRCPKKQRATLAEYRTFKDNLAALQPEEKIRFKQFLNAKQVRVVHVNAANRITNRIF